jgi:hypothetical protein
VGHDHILDYEQMRQDDLDRRARKRQRKSSGRRAILRVFNASGDLVLETLNAKAARIKRRQIEGFILDSRGHRLN